MGDEAPQSPSPSSSPTESSPTTKLPSASGCYFKQPAASTKCGGPFSEWERDTWGEQNADSGANEASCMARQSGHDAYCGVSTEWLYVAGGAQNGDASPSPTSIVSDALLDFVPLPCAWQQDLRSASGATFEGAKIRSDGGVELCKDCAQRCYAQMRDCVGFVMEPYSNDRPLLGKCTYFLRIDKIESAENNHMFALTAAAEVNVLTT